MIVLPQLPWIYRGDPVLGLVLFTTIFFGIMFGVYFLTQGNLKWRAKRAGRRSKRRIDKFWGIEPDSDESERFARELEDWPVLSKKEITQIKQSLKKKR